MEDRLLKVGVVTMVFALALTVVAVVVTCVGGHGYAADLHPHPYL